MAMEQRIDYGTHAPGVYKAMDALDRYLAGAVPRRLLLLVQLRTSQLNGCAYCIDMHWKDLRRDGDTEQRLAGLDAWRESPYYTPRERAALAWTEAVTLVREGHVPDAVHAEALAHLVPLWKAIGNEEQSREARETLLQRHGNSKWAKQVQ